MIAKEEIKKATKAWEAYYVNKHRDIFADNLFDLVVKYAQKQ